MNPNTPPPHDDDLPDERELAALYARLPKAEPDPALDAAVLAQADRALPARRRRARWPVALGSAAALVLAAGLGWQLRDSRPEAAATLRVPPAPGVASHEYPREQATASAVLRESAPAPAPQAKARRSAPAPVRVLAVPAPPAPAPAQASEQAFAPAPKSSAVSKPAAQVVGAVSDRAMKTDLGPDDRVGEIRQLLGRGEREEALRRLRELRERYPRYDLPQDLRDLIP